MVNLCLTHNQNVLIWNTDLIQRRGFIHHMMEIINHNEAERMKCMYHLEL